MIKWCQIQNQIIYFYYLITSMKHIFFLFLTFSVNAALADNWELFPRNQRNVYISTEQNSQHYVYAYKADSLKTDGNSTTYLFNQKPFTDSGSYCLSHFQNSTDFRWYQDPFGMDSIKQTGNHYEINIGGTIVKFNHLASVNESWKVTASENAWSIDYVIINCTSISEETIFGFSDSVKVFSITAYKKHDTIPQFASYHYRLSKSFGFIEFIPFRNLVFDDNFYGNLTRLVLQRMEIAGQVYGFSFPAFEDYFHYQPQDVLIWKNIRDWYDVLSPTTGEYYRDSLLTVTRSPDSVCMCIHREIKKFTEGLNDTSYSEINISRCFIANQFEPFLQLGAGQSAMVNNDFGSGHGGIGCWEHIQIKIDSSYTPALFSIHPHYSYYLDTNDCRIKIPYDYGADFKIDTKSGLTFYGEYGFIIDTTGLAGYIPGAGISGDCLPVGITPVSENGDHNLFIQPALASDYIQIESRDKERVSIEVYSLEGKVLFSAEKNPDDVIDIAFLPDGYYIVRLTAKDKIRTVKFLKQQEK